MSIPSPIPAVFLFAALTVTSAHASSLASATVSGLCSATQMATGPAGASAAASCSSSSASASTSFNVALPSLAGFKFLDSATPFNVSTSVNTISYSLFVTGGTGAGFLALDYVNSIFGSNDPQASANANLDVLLNGSILDSGRVCGNMPGTGGPFSCANSVPVGFGFTYGTPFTLTATLTGVAGGGLGGSQISGTGSFSYSILSNGAPNPTGVLNLVPEPSTFALAGLAIVCLAHAVRRNQRS